MSDLTVVYYSSSRERPEFEAGIVRELKAAADGHAIISVTQKPLELGRNICFGQADASPENAMRQLMIGLKAASTEFVALVESDCLFGAEWFRRRPEAVGRWCYPCPGYVIWEGRLRFWPKNMRELIGITHRQHAIQVIGTIIDEQPSHIADRIRQLTTAQPEMLTQPVITIKTRQQMHWATPHGSQSVDSLPGWGSAAEIWGKLL